MTILIYTNRADAHAQRMANVLAARGVRVRTIYSEDMVRNMHVSVRLINGEAKAVLSGPGPGPSTELSNVTCIWWRKPSHYHLDSAYTPHMQEFIKEEIDAALGGLCSVYQSAWVNHPADMTAASNKIEQLARTQAYGLLIPETLITNDRKALASFCRSHPQVVYKTLTGPGLAGLSCIRKGIPVDYSHSVALTRLITAEETELMADIRDTPCLFQAYIAARCEYRVTIVGERVFVAKHQDVADDAAGQTRGVDSRLAMKQARLLAASLPDAFIAGLHKLMKSYRLSYATFDVLEDHAGSLYLIDVNPNGQYLFVERSVPTFDITAALADLICGRSGKAPVNAPL